MVRTNVCPVCNKTSGEHDNSFPCPAPDDFFRPRNDFVLVRIVDIGRVGRVAIPEISIQGKEFVVVAIGPNVDDLQVGDKVLMVGELGVNYFPLPSSNSLLMIKQENVALVVGHIDESEGE